MLQANSGVAGQQRELQDAVDEAACQPNAILSSVGIACWKGPRWRLCSAGIGAPVDLFAG